MVLKPQILRKHILELLGGAEDRLGAHWSIRVAVGHVDDGRLGVLVLPGLQLGTEEASHEDHREGVGIDLLDDVAVLSLVVLLVLRVFLLHIVHQDRDAVLATDVLVDLLAQGLVLLPLVVIPIVEFEGLDAADAVLLDQILCLLELGVVVAHQHDVEPLFAKSVREFFSKRVSGSIDDHPGALSVPLLEIVLLDDLVCNCGVS